LRCPGLQASLNRSRARSSRASANPRAGGCETFESDGCRHDSHGAEAHDSDDEDRHQKGTAVAAVEA
jgi:hypothetical protein